MPRAPVSPLQHPLLLAAMLTLLSVLAWECLHGQAPEAAAPEPPAPSATVAAIPDPPNRREDDARRLLDRPLFASDRRPAAIPSAPGQPTSPASLPRLSGTLIAASIRRAIFETAGGSGVFAEGSHIGPYTIIRIEPQRATLQGPAGEQTIGISLGANQPPTSSAASAPDPHPPQQANSQPATFIRRARLQDLLAQERHRRGL